MIVSFDHDRNATAAATPASVSTSLSQSRPTPAGIVNPLENFSGRTNTPLMTSESGVPVSKGNANEQTTAVAAPVATGIRDEARIGSGSIDANTNIPTIEPVTSAARVVAHPSQTCCV